MSQKEASVAVEIRERDVLGLALAHAGRLDEAGDAFERATQLLEGASLERLATMLPIRDRERIAIVAEGIHLIGTVNDG